MTPDSADLPPALLDALLRLPLADTTDTALDGAVAELVRWHPDHAGAIRAWVAEMRGEPRRKRIGRYVVEGLLREGGQAVILRGRDPSVLERRVVIKALRPSATFGRTALARLRREARVAGNLDHDGICPVLDVVEEHGEVFLVFPHIDGDDLETHVERARTDGGVDSLWAAVTAPNDGDAAVGWHAAVRLVERVAQAVHAAHEAGVVHRDLKPSNIMVRPDGKPVVLDFGLALETAELAESGHRVTRSGDAIGTPCYMAPEQVEGRREDVGARTDVYALGVILFELLTLHRPFDGRTVSEVFSRINRGDPAPPRTWQPALSRDVEAVCLRSMHVEPPRRYANAAELAAELRRVLDGEPTEARPSGAFTRTWRAVRRRRLAAVPLAIAAAAITWWVVDGRSAAATGPGIIPPSANAVERDPHMTAAIDATFARCLGRAPSDAERDAAAATLGDQRHGMHGLLTRLLTGSEFMTLHSAPLDKLRALLGIVRSGHGPEVAQRLLARDEQRGFVVDGRYVERAPPPWQTGAWEIVVRAGLEEYGRRHGDNALPGEPPVHRWPRFPIVAVDNTRIYGAHDGGRYVLVDIELRADGKIRGNVECGNMHVALGYRAHVYLELLGVEGAVLRTLKLARCDVKSKLQSLQKNIVLADAPLRAEVRPELADATRSLVIRSFRDDDEARQTYERRLGR